MVRATVMTNVDSEAERPRISTTNTCPGVAPPSPTVTYTSRHGDSNRPLHACHDSLQHRYDGCANLKAKRGVGTRWPTQRRRGMGVGGSVLLLCAGLSPMTCYHSHATGSRKCLARDSGGESESVSGDGGGGTIMLHWHASLCNAAT